VKPPHPDPTPSTAVPVDLVRMRDRYAERLRREGAENPRVAATVAAIRGTAGETVEEFALRLEIPIPAVTAAEAGLLPLESLPAALAFTVRRFDHPG